MFTLLYWGTTLAAVAVGAGLSSWLAIMATSLDPAEMIQAGADPWVNAGWAALLFIALCAMAAIGVRLWHTRRFRLIALAILAAEVAAVVIATLDFYVEYV